MSVLLHLCVASHVEQAARRVVRACAKEEGEAERVRLRVMVCACAEAVRKLARRAAGEGGAERERAAKTGASGLRARAPRAVPSCRW